MCICDFFREKNRKIVRTAVEKNCNFGQNLTILTEYAPFFDKNMHRLIRINLQKLGVLKM